MKVTGPNGPHTIHSLRNNEQGKAAPKQQPAPVRAETVQLSSSAAALAKAHDVPSNDRTRIERLKAEIKNGTFRVDPERIAEKMLAEERGPREA